MATLIQFRRGTAAQWTSANPTLHAGELGFETDTEKFKIGNGSLAWVDLTYGNDLPSEVDSLIASAVSTHANLTSAHGVTGSVVGTTDSQTLTNKTINGSNNTLSNIGNSSLTYHSVTINGNEIALGGSHTFNTDAIGEGTSHFYFTSARARAAVADDIANAIAGVTISSTDAVPEGVTNLYFTNQRALDATAAAYDAAGAAATAQSTAESYTDGKISTEVTNRNNAISTSLSTAESYTDSAVSTHAGLSTGTHGVAGTFVGTTDTQTLTHKTISGSTNTLSNIANASLVNSKVTINTHDLSLGASLTLSTDDIGEGSTNQYFTLTRAEDAAVTAITAGTGVTKTTGSHSAQFSIGQSVGTTDNVTFNDVTVSGNLDVKGTVTTIESTTVTVKDKNIELGNVTTPTDTTANGGGITLHGTTDKTLNWLSGTSSWTSSENVDLASGKTYKIAGTDVLTSTQVLGKSVPTGTIVGTSDSQTLTGKTISGASNTLTNIANSSLTNSKVTVGTTDLVLGTTITDLAGVTINSTTIPTSKTLVTTADTGSVSNTMLAGSITNAKLVNSKVTVGTTDISLGASSTTLAGLTSVTSSAFVGDLTGNVSGNASTVTNGVYTTDTGSVTNTMLAGSIADSKLLTISTSGKVANSATTATSSNTTGAIVARNGSGNFSAGTITANLTGNVTGTVSDLSNHTTSDLTEGTNLYYTAERAQDDVFNAVVNGSGISTTYNDPANTFTIAVDSTVATLTGSQTLTNKTLTSPVINTPTGIVKADVGLGNVNNTSDANKPISTATQTALDGKLLLSGGTMTGTLILAADPVNTLDAATKNYVDAAVTTLNVHAAAAAASTTNLTATYANGTSGVGATLTASGGAQNTVLSLDGVNPAVGARVLIKNQTTAFQNGIYTVTATGKANPGGSNWVLTRATDYDQTPEVKSGDFLFITGGSTQANTGWTETATVTTIGTDALSFTQFSGAGTYLAGTGLTLTGNTFAIDSTVTTLTGTQTLTNKTLTTPTIATILNNSGTLTLPTTTDTLVGRATTDTLTNKSISGSTNTLTNIPNSALTNSTISGVSLGSNLNALTIGTGLSGSSYNGSAGVTVAIDSTVATLTGIQTLTNKTISGASNTLTNIGNSSLTNSSITINGTSFSLGDSKTIKASTTNALTIGTGLSGTSFDGSGAVTIAIDSTVATLTGIQTLTNKTLTLPTVGGTGANFAGSTSGTINLVATGTAGTNTITLPATTGNVVTTGDSGTVTNTMLAGSISNAKLTNSSVTIGSTSISLGSSASSFSGLTLTSPVISTISNTGTLTLPTSTDTLVGKATTDTFTNKTFDTAGTGNSLKINGTSITAVTGTGAVALAASPTFTGTLNAAAVTTTGDVIVGGNLTVNGTVETINSTTVTVADKNIELGSVATPTDTTANGGGITIKGATDKTLNWVLGTTSWTSSENVDLATGKTYKIAGTTVLSGTQIFGKTIGGTTAGDVVDLNTAQTLTNKTISGSSNTLSNIANASLTNSSITVNGTSFALGDSKTIKASTTNALTIGTGLSGTSFDGSAAVTIANTGVLTVNGSAGAVTGIATTAGNLGQFAATTSSQLAGVISDETGSGALVFATSPTLVTPTLGVASATSVNKVAVTAPATSATLTLADGSTLATSGANSITLTSTGATTVTLPTTGTLVNTAVTSLSSLATVGTITSGTWNGTAVGLLYGGTGATTQAGAANAVLPSQSTNSGKYLTTDGTNVSWGTVDLTTRVAKTDFAAKGDVLVGTGSGTYINVGVGTNGYALIADSTQTAGVKWGQVATDPLPQALMLGGM